MDKHIDRSISGFLSLLSFRYGDSEGKRLCQDGVFYLSLEIMMNTKFLKKAFAVFAGFMLLSNVFLPSAVVFAEEGVPEVTVTEKVNQESENPAQQGGEETVSSDSSVSPSEAQQENQEKKAEADLVQTEVLDQIAEELPNQEIPAELITKWGVNVEESSSSSKLVKYYSVQGDEEISLLMKEDWTVDYKATQNKHPDTVKWYLNEKSQVVDFGWEKVIFTQGLAPLFEKMDSIYRKALKNPGSVKDIPSSLSYDLEASLKGEWTPLGSFVKYVEVRNAMDKVVWYFLLTPQASADFVYVPLAGEAKIGNHGFMTLQEAIDSANDGDEIKLLKDVAATQVIEIKKSITIDGDSHILDSTAKRWMWIEAPDVNVTIKNLTIKSSNENMERAIQVNDYKNITLNVDNCDLSASAYTINVINGSSNTTMNISNSKVLGWSAVNLWGSWGQIKISDSVLIGVNNRQYNASWRNDFWTLVIEWDTTNVTDIHAEAYDVILMNTKIESRVETEGNKQDAILFNHPSSSNRVVVDGSSVLQYEGSSLVSLSWDKNKLILNSGIYSSDPKVKYLWETKCSIKNSDSKYEVKDCPQATNFYTSNNNPIPVVLDGTGIKINETKAVLNKLVAKSPVLASSVEIQILSGLNSVNGVVEVKEVAGEKLLFLNMATTWKNQTKVFRVNKDGLFGTGAFKSAGASTATGTITPDLDHAIVPSWVDKNKPIKAYHEIKKDGKVIGYTLQTQSPDFWWFYAPKNYTITFDSNGGTAVAPITGGALTTITAPYCSYKKLS